VGVLPEIQEALPEYGWRVTVSANLLTSNSFHCSTKPLSIFATSGSIFINVLKGCVIAEAVGCSPSLHTI